MMLIDEQSNWRSIKLVKEKSIKISETRDLYKYYLQT